MMRSRWLWLVAVALLTGAVSIYWPTPPEPDPKRFPVRGVDVSHHQGVVDWTKLPAERVRFVYLKASEGGDWTDPLFAVNLAAAPHGGIALGAYHYFTLCASGRRQAANFLAAIGGTAKLTLPPAVDVEYVGNCSARPPRAAVQRELLDFIARVSARLGRTPVLYSTESFFEDYLTGPKLANQPLWVRNLVGEAQWSKGRRVLFRQFSDHARFDGLKGPVDVDVFMGSQAEFAALQR